MKPIRVGCIGLGWITQRAHLPALAALAEEGQVVFQAFCDKSEETLQEQAAVYKPHSTYTDHHQMFAEQELDAVYLSIPPTAHTDEVLIAADQGVALFVEKPQTLDLAQVAEFNAAIEKAGIVSQVGFVSRYEPSSAPTLELLQQRTPRHAQIQNFYSGQPIRYWTSRYELCGGSFVENTIHSVDLLRYLLGDIEAVSAFYVESLPDERIEPMNLPHVYNVNYRFKEALDRQRQRLAGNEQRRLLQARNPRRQRRLDHRMESTKSDGKRRGSVGGQRRTAISRSLLHSSPRFYRRRSSR